MNASASNIEEDREEEEEADMTTSTPDDDGEEKPGSAGESHNEDGQGDSEIAMET